MVLTLIGLPGIWLMLAFGIGLELWQPGSISWWTFGVAAVVACIGEIIEFAAGAVGSRMVGGSKSSAVGAIVGGMIGAIAGVAFPPIIGAIIWGSVGAGIGAILGELSAGRREWKDSFRTAGAAASGKFVGTLGKFATVIVVYVMILIALLMP